MPIPLNGVRTCTSGIRAHRSSDYTTRAGTPRISRNKHFRHSPASSIVKHNHAKKHSNSYLRDRDVRHLQGPPLSRTKRVRERRKTELIDDMRGKRCPLPSTEFEPVPLGYCKITKFRSRLDGLAKLSSCSNGEEGQILPELTHRGPTRVRVLMYECISHVRLSSEQDR